MLSRVFIIIHQTSENKNWIQVRLTTMNTTIFEPILLDDNFEKYIPYHNSTSTIYLNKNSDFTKFNSVNILVSSPKTL